MNESWQALAREAGLAAEHLAIGATTLGKANYARKAYYSQAFFALAIGLERATKLALVVDHALEHGGDFPRHKVLRSYGHDLEKLLELTDKIAERHGSAEPEDRLPRTTIHKGIILVLSEFANNITRYYNLDLITGDARTAERDEPVRAWFDLVTTPILNVHYRQCHYDKHQRNARLASDLLSGHTAVHHHSDSVFQGS
jgi:hypothetical protein